LTFTVNVAKTLQAIALVRRDTFHEWRLGAEDGELSFGLNLSTLLECLKIFGITPGGALDKPPTMSIGYRESSACLYLTIVEGSCVTECELHTLELEQPARVELDVAEGARPPLVVTVPSDMLKSGIDELDWGGDANRDKRLTLSASLQPPMLSLTVASTDLGCEMVFPANSLSHFQCSACVSYDYRYLLLSMALRSLKDSQSAQLTVDKGGLLQIKLCFPSGSGGGAELYSLFYTHPLVDDDEYEDGIGGTAMEADAGAS